MGFGEEWAQRTSLKHSEAMKRKAARYIEEHLGPDTRTAGRMADDANDAVTGATTGSPSGTVPWAPGAQHAPVTFSPLGRLRGWEVQIGLGHRQREWQRHRRQLEGRLGAEASALREVNFMFGRQDTLAEASFTALSDSGLAHTGLSDAGLSDSGLSEPLPPARRSGLDAL